MDKEKRLHEILDLVQEKQIDTLTAKRDILILFNVVESAFSFNDLEVWGGNSGATGIVFNVPEPGRESVCLKHIPTGKIGHVELNT